MIDFHQAKRRRIDHALVERQPGYDRLDAVAQITQRQSRNSHAVHHSSQGKHGEYRRHRGRSRSPAHHSGRPRTPYQRDGHSSESHRLRSWATQHRHHQATEAPHTSRRSRATNARRKRFTSGIGNYTREAAKQVNQGLAKDARANETEPEKEKAAALNAFNIAFPEGKEADAKRVELGSLEGDLTVEDRLANYWWRLGSRRSPEMLKKLIELSLNQSAGCKSGDEYKTIVKRLERAQEHVSEHERVPILETLINRAYEIYGRRLLMGPAGRALECYKKIAKLPASNTRLDLDNSEGLMIKGPFHRQPTRAILLEGWRKGAVPVLIKFPVTDEATLRETEMHKKCQDIEGILGPVELTGFGRLKLISPDSTEKQVKADRGIVIPMMSSSLDQCTHAVPEEDILLRCPVIISALETMHSRGVIHNDLKPANILVTHDGSWKLGNFGSATEIGVEPLERNGVMSPSRLSASPRTDRIMLANSLLLLMHLRDLTEKTDVHSLKIAADRINLAPLRNIVQELFV